MSLSLDRVTFRYQDGPTVLEDASLEIEQGAYVLVQGESGAGKSTLLRLLCRLEEVQEGKILFKGEPIEVMAPADLRRKVAYVQQMPTLLPGKVGENLILPFRFRANAELPIPDTELLSNYLSSFLLRGITLDTKADCLSVGQSQRICLIRSLLLSPEVVLMDEPTASLDIDSAMVVLDKAAELSAGGTTVIMISHSKDIPAGVTHVARIENRKLEYMS